MANFGTVVKREAATQAWVLWITQATGVSPYVERSDSGNKIIWREGQAKLMRDYLDNSMRETAPNAINVSVDLKPVLIPLVIKKTLGYVIGYTALSVFLGMLLKRGY